MVIAWFKFTFPVVAAGFTTFQTRDPDATEKYSLDVLVPPDQDPAG
jgi:hypothetical protein